MIQFDSYFFNCLETGPESQCFEATGSASTSAWAKWGTKIYEVSSSWLLLCSGMVGGSCSLNCLKLCWILEGFMLLLKWSPRKVSYSMFFLSEFARCFFFLGWHCQGVTEKGYDQTQAWWPHHSRIHGGLFIRLMHPFGFTGKLGATFACLCCCFFLVFFLQGPIVNRRCCCNNNRGLLLITIILMVMMSLIPIIYSH